MSDLRTAQQQRMRTEQQRAVRALLARPLLTASGRAAEDFMLVRRHDTALRRFFADQVGWTLQVDREMARLRKLPGQLTDGSRPAAGLGNMSISPCSCPNGLFSRRG